MEAEHLRACFQGSDFVSVLDLEREETGKDAGVENKDSRQKVRKIKYFPNLITQSEPTETGERTHCKESLG